MGTKLIIPNANFTINRISNEKWYTNLTDVSTVNTQSFFPNSLIGYGEFPGFAAAWFKLGFDGIYGKNINKLKIYCKYNPASNISKLVSKNIKLAIYKAKLNKNWDDLNTWGNFPVYSNDDVTIEKIEDIDPINLEYIYNNSNEYYECKYKLSNNVILNDSSEFISLGSPYFEGTLIESRPDAIMPYTGIDVPIETLDANPSLYLGLNGETERNAGVVKCIYIPAIDFGFE